MSANLGAVVFALIGSLTARKGILNWRGSAQPRLARLILGDSITWFIPAGTGMVVIAVAVAVLDTAGRPAAQIVAYAGVSLEALGMFVLFVNPRWSQPPFLRRQTRDVPDETRDN